MEQYTLYIYLFPKEAKSISECGLILAYMKAQRVLMDRWRRQYYMTIKYTHELMMYN